MPNRLIRNISDSTWRALKEIAASRGIYEHPRADKRAVTHRDARKPKRGSVRGLLEHIASGDALVMLIPDDDANAESMLDDLQIALDDARQRSLQYDIDNS